MTKSYKKTIYEALGRDPVHPFPARMAPGIALDAIGESQVPLRVLDPMAGSGTVLAVARAKGHRAIGIDIDPLAVLLAGVWTRTIDPDEVNDKAEQVLDRAKIEFGPLTSGNAYPIGSDKETRKFIRYWFDDYARRQLTALSDDSPCSRRRNARCTVVRLFTPYHHQKRGCVTRYGFSAQPSSPSLRARAGEALQSVFVCRRKGRRELPSH
jgi:hypothetical protein